MATRKKSRVVAAAPGYLFFAQQGDDGPIFAGCAYDPGNVMLDLQRASTEPLRLLKIAEGTSHQLAELLKRFERDRRPGTDWLNPSPDLLAHVQSLPAVARVRRTAPWAQTRNHPKVTMTLPPDVVARLEELAGAWDMSKSAVVARLIATARDTPPRMPKPE